MDLAMKKNSIENNNNNNNKIYIEGWEKRTFFCKNIHIFSNT
jgi:hypothetical protein